MKITENRKLKIKIHSKILPFVADGLADGCGWLSFGLSEVPGAKK